MSKTPLTLERPTTRNIATVTAAIVRDFHPQKIVLFGSHAYGSPARDSDVDLLVVMSTEQHPVDQAVAIRQVVDFPFPVDLLVRTPEQVTERLHMGDLFMREIVNRGRVLYEADHT